MAARRFDNMHNILRSPSLVQSLLKDRNAQISANGNQRIWDLREPTR